MKRLSRQKKIEMCKAAARYWRESGHYGLTITMLAEAIGRIGGSRPEGHVDAIIDFCGLQRCHKVDDVVTNHPKFWINKGTFTYGDQTALAKQNAPFYKEQLKKGLYSKLVTKKWHGDNNQTSRRQLKAIMTSMQKVLA